MKAKAIAINTFLPKNCYRPLEGPRDTQRGYATFYGPPLYGAPQQFPLYGVVAPQAWLGVPGFLDPALVSTPKASTFFNFFFSVSQINCLLLVPTGGAIS